MAKAPIIKLATANATQHIKRRCSAMVGLPFVASVFLIRIARSSSSEIVHALGCGERPHTAPCDWARALGRRGHKLQICLSWWRVWVRSTGFYRRIFLQAFQELSDDLRSRRGDP